MKLAVSTYSLMRWRKENNKTLAQSVEKIAELGAAGVEFTGLGTQWEEVKRPLAEAAKLRRLAKKLGLIVCGYCTGANLLVPPDQQRKTIERLKAEVDVAAELGVRSMRHDVCPGFRDYPDFPGPQSFAAALKVVVPALREVTEHGRKRGVVTSLENHGFFMQHPQRVKKLLDTVDDRNYRLTIDLGNFLCVGADPVAAAKLLMPYVTHVHIKDFHVKRKENSPGLGWFNTPGRNALRGAIVGHGVIDVPAQLRILKRGGYRGFLSLEFEGLEEPVFAVKTGLEYLRGQLKALKG